MSIASRKQKEKENMRTLILDAARSIFLEKGYEQTSIRNIAERIDYSPGTIYLYFKEKDEIFHALHEEGFSRLLEQMQPLQFVSEPFERLKAMGRVYMEFAKNNKDFYDLMFIMHAPMKIEQIDQWEMGDKTLNYLKQVIGECMAVGRFQGRDVNFLSFTIWASLHGMCALYCRERCQAYHDEHIEHTALLKGGFQNFVDMLEKL